MGRFTDFISNLLFSSVAKGIDAEAKALHEKIIWTKKNEDKLAADIAECHAAAQQLFEEQEKTRPRDPEHVRVDAMIARNEALFAELNIKTAPDEPVETPAQKFLTERNTLKLKSVKALVKLGISNFQAKNLVNEVLTEKGNARGLTVEKVVELALKKQGK